MDTTSVAPATRPDTRELRALELHRTRGHEIRKVGEDLYLVPSCTGQGFYSVDYREESCDCPDHAIRQENCKHILAVGITRASRRSGVREVRTLRVVSGDPFAYAGKRGGCSGCFGGYVTLTVEEDGDLYHEAVPCRRCQR